jgi:ATP-dependent DNA helicase PIF1
MIRTINKTIYDKFQQACYALGLISDDKEYVGCITKAFDLATGCQLRQLFVYLLVSKTMSNPDLVWEKTWIMLSDGILFERRRVLNLLGNFYNLIYMVYIFLILDFINYLFTLQYLLFADLHLQDSDLQKLCLLETEKILNSNGRSIREFSCMPSVDYSELNAF